MVCPLYVDFTRTCINKFPMLVKVTTFEVCESDQYEKCQIYMICTSAFNCEFLEQCTNQYIEKLPKFVTNIFMTENGVKEMTDVLIDYCLSPEKSKTCAKYTVFCKGEVPPINLLPDGRKITPFDILFKKKISVTSDE